jgi:predicted AAA+ superfamily ATPase
MNMKRLSMEHLKNWHQKATRMPLILRGARQVGKSTLVRLFCEAENLDLIEINLEKEILQSAQNQKITIANVIDEVQLRSKKQIHEKTLIFFDEIQEQPSLLKQLRYFYEERPDIAIIAAGSLLEIAVREEKFSFPVGRVEFHNLGPMTFIEYLWATDNKMLADKILNLDFSPAVSTLAKEHLRNYLYIGGMPKAVKTYVEEKSLFHVRDIQEQILQAFVADFARYNAKLNIQRAQRVFAASVTQIGKKTIYKKIDPESQSRDVRRIIELLVDARVLLSCTHSDGNSEPLIGQSDASVQKLYFLDVGLANCQLRLDLNAIDVELKNDFNTKGTMAEQFVAQHIALSMGSSLNPQLHYWLRDKGTQKGEVDFLIEFHGLVVPVEIKATASGHLKSLFYFVKEKKKKIAIKFSMADYKTETIRHKIGDEMIECTLISVPLFAVDAIRNVMNQSQSFYPEKTILTPKSIKFRA